MLMETKPYDRTNCTKVIGIINKCELWLADTPLVSDFYKLVGQLLALACINNKGDRELVVGYISDDIEFVISQLEITDIGHNQERVEILLVQAWHLLNPGNEFDAITTEPDGNDPAPIVIRNPADDSLQVMSSSGNVMMGIRGHSLPKSRQITR